MIGRAVLLPLVFLVACQSAPERAPVTTGPAPDDAIGARIEVYGPI